jgi:hypothetical protein
MITASVIVFGGALYGSGERLKCLHNNFLPNGKFNLQQILPDGQIFFAQGERSKGARQIMAPVGPRQWLLAAMTAGKGRCAKGTRPRRPDCTALKRAWEEN